MNKVLSFVRAGWEFYTRARDARAARREIAAYAEAEEEVRKIRHGIGRWLASTSFQERNAFLKKAGFPEIRMPPGAEPF